jgi:hypothetical protein
MAKAKKAATMSTDMLESAAAPGVASVTATVSITFTSGLGQATASLFRKGMLINMQSVSTSGTIVFSDTQSGDVISVNGICTGAATIAVNVPTTPGTPQNFPAGPFHVGLFVN